MKDIQIAPNNACSDEIHQFCREIHRQTGVFIRVTAEEDFESLAGLVKLSASPKLQADLKRLHPKRQTNFQ